MTLNDIVVSNCVGMQGGAIYAEDAHGVYCSNVLAVDNYASYKGGAFCYNRVGSASFTGTISGNTAYYAGGGVYLTSVSDMTLTALISQNDVDETSPDHMRGAAMFISGTNVNLRIRDCVITNNYSSGGTILHIEMAQSGADFPMTGLMFSNNVIGGCGTGGAGVYSNISAIDEDNDNLSGHILVGNRFVTNWMGYLYIDSGGNSPLSTGDGSWTNLNIPTYSQASVAYGNSVESF